MPDPDYASAMTWYRRAADQDDVPSMAAIANFYEHGFGVERNRDLAMKWYSKAAELGDSTSRVWLEILSEQKEPAR
jgi:TPR repeat protein